MKTHKMFNEMAFQVTEKFEFLQFFVELQQKLKISAKIFKFYSTKRENAFENLNHISFFT